VLESSACWGRAGQRPLPLSGQGGVAGIVPGSVLRGFIVGLEKNRKEFF